MEPTAAAPFTPEMTAAYERARAKLDPARLKQLLFEITDIHSPTGATRNAAEFVAGHMGKIGLKPMLDPMSPISANVLGEKRGSGGGATLLLYAPIDTHLEGDESDFPWAGPEQFADLRPSAKMVGDWVYGLGSSNPKAMVAGSFLSLAALCAPCSPFIRCRLPDFRKTKSPFQGTIRLISDPGLLLRSTNHCETFFPSLPGVPVVSPGCPHPEGGPACQDRRDQNPFQGRHLCDRGAGTGGHDSRRKGSLCNGCGRRADPSEGCGNPASLLHCGHQERTTRGRGSCAGVNGAPEGWAMG